MCTERWLNDADKENGTILRDPLASATLSTKNPTWTGLGSSRGPCGKKPVNNRLNHGTKIHIARTASLESYQSHSQSKNSSYES
jgi:hypothetical protein